MSVLERLAGGPPAWATRRGRLALALNRRRRVVAAVLVAVAALIVAAGLRAPPPPTVGVLVAAHDLAGGAPLRPGDVTTVRLPAAAVPDGAVHDHASGRRTAGPLRRGEPLTDARLLGPGMLAGYPPGTVAAPVRVADAELASLLHAGDHVDVLAAGPPGDGDPAGAPPESAGGTARASPEPGDLGGAPVVARDVPVLAVAGGPAGGTAGSDGALVIVAVPAAVAGGLARAGVGARLSVTIRSR